MLLTKSRVVITARSLFLAGILSSSSVLAGVDEARTSFEKGKVQDAIFMYQELLDSDFNHYGAYIGLIDVLLYAQRFNDAKAYIDVASGLYPRDHSLLLQKGIAESALENMAVAKTAFEQALALKPSDYKTVVLSHAFFKEIGDNARAQKLQARLLKLIQH